MRILCVPQIPLRCDMTWGQMVVVSTPAVVIGCRGGEMGWQGSNKSSSERLSHRERSHKVMKSPKKRCPKFSLSVYECKAIKEKII